MDIISRLYVDKAEEGWLWTYHKKYLTIINNRLSQTDDPEKICLKAIRYHKSIALLNSYTNLYITAITNNGSFTQSPAIHFFEAIEVQDQANTFMIRAVNLQLSARSASENLRVTLVEHKNKWEQFKFILTSTHNITSKANDILISIEKYTQDMDRLLNYQIKKLEKDIDILKAFYRRTADPSAFVNELSAWYKSSRYSNPNFDIFNPKTFNDKLQYIKLFGNIPLMTQLSDKIEVRKYISNKGLSDILIPIYGIYTRPHMIDYDALPDTFVIKCNHGSGMNIVVNSKKEINIDSINKTLTDWLSRNYAASNYEMQYRGIPPKILVEKNIADNGALPTDYKIFCFHGEPHIIALVLDRGPKTTRSAVFDTTWTRLNTNWHFPDYPSPVQRPQNLEKMLQIAKILSAGIPHVRVDLYHTDDGTIYFGEMTFISLSGLNDWSDKQMDEQLGNLLQLDIK